MERCDRSQRNRSIGLNWEGSAYRIEFRSLSRNRSCMIGTMKEKFEKWGKWLKLITNECHTMYLHRFMWDELQAMIQKNQPLAETESYFWNWQFDCYSKNQAMAIRRQADTHRESISLDNLLRDIEANPTMITKDWYVSHWGVEYPDWDQEYWKQEGEKSWKTIYAGTTADHIDPEIVKIDRDRLSVGSKKVQDYVNNNVAHFDKRILTNPPKPPCVDEVHDAVDLVGELIQKYNGLFTAAHLFMMPVLQHDWESIFQIPWSFREEEYRAKMAEYGRNPDGTPLQ